MFLRDPLKYNGWNSAVTLSHLMWGWLLFAWCLEGGQKQVRKGVHLYMCFLVPLSCTLVLCNHIHATWQPEVSVINCVHVTRTRQQLEQVVCAWLSVPCHISALSKKSLTCSIQFKECLTVFKGFDGKASDVWLVITPCSKFILVLKENNVVNISPFSEPPVLSPSVWWSCFLKGFKV